MLLIPGWRAGERVNVVNVHKVGPGPREGRVRVNVVNSRSWALRRGLM